MKVTNAQLEAVKVELTRIIESKKDALITAKKDELNKVGSLEASYAKLLATSAKAREELIKFAVGALKSIKGTTDFGMRYWLIAPVSNSAYSYEQLVEYCGKCAADCARAWENKRQAIIDYYDGAVNDLEDTLSDAKFRVSMCNAPEELIRFVADFKKEIE